MDELRKKTIGLAVKSILDFLMIRFGVDYFEAKSMLWSNLDEMYVGINVANDLIEELLVSGEVL